MCSDIIVVYTCTSIYELWNGDITYLNVLSIFKKWNELKVVKDESIVHLVVILQKHLILCMKLWTHEE